MAGWLNIFGESMDLQSIATESQTLRSTIRDLRSVIATDKERLERHEGELKAALERVEVLEREAQVAFEAIRAPTQQTDAVQPPQQIFMQEGDVRRVFGDSIFGEPSQVAAE